MKQDLTTNAERMRGLRNRPYIVGPPVRSYLYWRAQLISDWERGLELHRAQLLGAILLLLVPGVIGAAWLFSRLGWIR